MARFVFQLEGVLKLRSNIERERQRELALVVRQMQELRDQLAGLDQSVQDSRDDLRRNHLVGRLDLAFLAAHRRFIGSMQARAMTLVQRMAMVQRQIDQARSSLAEAAKQRKIIEKVRERQYQRWMSDLRRRQDLALDEATTQLSFHQLQEQFQMDESGDAA